MNFKNKLAAITAAAMLAFTGVGFAAWTFNKDVQETSQATVVVTEESEKGTLEILTTDLYVILDQAEIFYATDAAGSSKVTKLDAKYTAEADGNLGEKMDVDFKLAWSGAVTEWATYVNGLEDVDLGTKIVVNGENALSFDLPALSYTSSKPSTEAEYDAMKAALDGKQLTITVTADALADDVAD